jgi:hypothetical protein
MVAKGHESLPEGRLALAKMMTPHWFVEHGKHILTASVAIAALLFFLLPLSKRFTSGRADYLKAETAFSTWAAQEKHDLALFKQVSDPLARHPELAAKFGAMIAQRLLTLGETKLAESYAQAALKRTHALLSPYHALFSENTLLISQGRLQEALEAAYQLKNRMAQDDVLWTNDKYSTKGGRTLYAYNLLRIASLEREVGSQNGERAAWDDILHNAGWEGRTTQAKTYDPEAFKILAENFQTGDVSLVDFIHQRKKELGRVVN